ncbi:NUDIX domain-containing protein [Streptomyces sp. NPDC015680]|uniref:NUDIX domain-containing protein n=1 Tax=Streptomyces sp. NPDC015680 TaxID=3364962 RepID=UPI0036FFA9AC
MSLSWRHCRFAVDLATKQIALADFSPADPASTLGGFLKFTLVSNSGAAFSVGEGATWLFSVAKLIVIIGMLWDRITRTAESGARSRKRWLRARLDRTASAHHPKAHGRSGIVEDHRVRARRVELHRPLLLDGAVVGEDASAVAEADPLGEPVGRLHRVGRRTAASARITCMDQGNIDQQNTGASPPGQIDPLLVIAAAVVQDGRLLVVSKKAAPDVFYLPGGKPDADEDMLETLARELEEELGVQPLEPRFLADIEAVAALEGVPMKMTVFEARLGRPPRPAAELAHMRWVSGDEDGTQLAPAVRDHVLPLLRRSGVLVA